MRDRKTVKKGMREDNWERRMHYKLILKEGQIGLKGKKGGCGGYKGGREGKSTYSTSEG